MRKGAIILENLEHRKLDTQKTFDLITSQTINSPSYKPLMNMLHGKSSNEIHNKAKFKSKKIEINNQQQQNTNITDADKTLCKVIISSMHQTSETNTRKISYPYEQYKQSANILTSAVATATAISSTRRKHIQQIQKEENERTTQIGPTAEQKEMQKKRKLRISLRSPNGLLSGQYMFQAIQELRKHSPGSVYIANTEAMENLNKAFTTSTWKTFGRAFNSTGVTNSKPHGVYLIPRFSGNASSGHWTLIAIHKHSAGCIGFHIDSLGLSGTTGAEFQELQSIFSGGREFVWQNTRSVPQTEMECGFRTIQAMLDICDGIRNGRDISSCIQAATFNNTNAEAYDPQKIRLIGTNVITGNLPQITCNKEVEPGAQEKQDKEQKHNRKRKKRARKRSIYKPKKRKT